MWLRKLVSAKQLLKKTCRPSLTSPFAKPRLRFVPATAWILLCLLLSTGCQPSMRGSVSTGGDVPVDAERLQNVRLTQIHESLSWKFIGGSVEITSPKGDIPAPFVDEILGDKSTPQNITASWELIDNNTKLRLYELSVDGQPSSHEAQLKISPAGPIRINLGIDQYNMYRIEAD